MGDMKEIHDAALAYYHNLSKGQQLKVYAFFQAIDADGDGAITIKEFTQILELSPSDVSGNTLFREMDKNGDGRLNFEEAITFYYVLCSERLISCDGCKASFIKEHRLYFTCVDCFERNQSKTFDLCISCYGSRNYVHEHCNFLSNSALQLRTKPACSNTTSTNQTARSVESDEYYARKAKKAEYALKATKFVTEIGNAAVAAGACIIM